MENRPIVTTLLQAAVQLSDIVNAAGYYVVPEIVVVAAVESDTAAERGHFAGLVYLWFDMTVVTVAGFGCARIVPVAALE